MRKLVSPIILGIRLLCCSVGPATPLNLPDPTAELYIVPIKPIVGIFGPGCSSVAIHVASTAPLFNFVVFSASAG